MNNIPQWQPDEDVDACFLCQKKYTLFFRRHHCRRCGKVVCGSCSSTSTAYEAGCHVVSPPNQVFPEIQNAQHRTCDLCVEEMITEGVLRDGNNEQLANPTNPMNVPTGRNRRIKTAVEQRTVNVEETDDDSERDSCPVCGALLRGKNELQREEHINDCLLKAEFSGSPEHPRASSNRMLVYYVPLPDKRPVVISCSEASTSTLQAQTPPITDEKELDKDEECVICLEEFKPGDEVGRLECLCVFHYKCIKSWFKQKGPGECPVHAVHA